MTSRMSRRRWASLGAMGLLGCAAAVYLTGLGLEVQPAGQPAPKVSRPKLFYWNCSNNEHEVARSKIDWAQRVDFGPAPVRRDIIMLYGQHLGNYPRFGLHQAQKLGYLEEHLRKVRKDVEQRIPVGFTGLVCIDYENWNVLWDRLANEVSPPTKGPDDEDRDFRDDWRDHLRATQAGWRELSAEQQEKLCKATYDRTAKEFFLKTLAACKEVRPEARWGYFDYPNALYSGLENAGGIGYNENGRGLACERNDEIMWLYDASDALFPASYCIAKSLPASENPRLEECTNTIEENRRFIYTHTLEAVRLAKGKPVVSYMWPRYLCPGKPLNETFYTDVNLRQSLEVPFEAGADAVAIWGHINAAADFPPLQQYVRDHLAPMIVKVLHDVP